MVFLLLVSVFFRRPLTFIIPVGGIGVRGGIKMASAVHAVQLKPTVKEQISGRMASISLSDVVSASLYSEKTRMKKLMMMMKMIIIINEV